MVGSWWILYKVLQPLGTCRVGLHWRRLGNVCNVQCEYCMVGRERESCRRNYSTDNCDVVMEFFVWRERTKIDWPRSCCRQICLDSDFWRCRMRGSAAGGSIIPSFESAFPCFCRDFFFKKKRWSTPVDIGLLIIILFHIFPPCHSIFTYSVCIFFFDIVEMSLHLVNVLTSWYFPLWE